jgi:PleD family two-component response regulator
MGKGRLLVVEDDPDIGNMLRIFFSGRGYAVHVTSRGRDALMLTRQELPNLIILDIMLPDLDGYAVCKELRTVPRTSHVPIIFLTQKDERSDRITGLQLGVDDYITKPFDIEELELRIQNAIARSERESLTDPRTGLPAGKLIEEQLERLLRQSDWGLLDCRIENVEAYTDRYGFVAADDVVRFVALMLGEIVDALGTEDDFIGHDLAGGFVVVTNAGCAEAIATRIRQRFTEEAASLNARPDSSAANVLGGEMPIPLLTMTVGIALASQGPYKGIRDLAEAAARARHRDTGRQPA